MGETETFKPKDVDLANPNIDWLFGTQVDIGPFNVDLIYNLGSDKFGTRRHTDQLT